MGSRAKTPRPLPLSCFRQIRWECFTSATLPFAPRAEFDFFPQRDAGWCRVFLRVQAEQIPDFTAIIPLADVPRSTLRLLDRKADADGRLVFPGLPLGHPDLLKHASFVRKHAPSALHRNGAFAVFHAPGQPAVLPDVRARAVTKEGQEAVEVSGDVVPLVPLQRRTPVLAAHAAADRKHALERGCVDVLDLQRKPIGHRQQFHQRYLTYTTLSSPWPKKSLMHAVCRYCIFS